MAILWFNVDNSVSNIEEMMIQCITPLYGRDDQFLGGALVTLSMASTASLLKQIDSTPGGIYFSMQ